MANTFPSSGNAGVGTTSPAYPLEVVGEIRSTANLVEKFASFTPTAVGWYRILSGGPERLGGVVRIYTPTQYDNTYTDIEISIAQPGYGSYGMICQLRHLNYNGGVVSQVRSSTDGGSNSYVDIYISTATTPQVVKLYGYGPGMIDFVSSPTVGATAGTNPVTITTGGGFRTTDHGVFLGNVGVGTNDSSSAKLNISNPSGVNGLRLRNQSSAVGAYLSEKNNGEIILSNNVDITDALDNGTKSAWKMSLSGSDSLDAFVLQAISAGQTWGSWRGVFSVLNNGNTGIGTMAPQTKLHISGSASSDDLLIGNGNTSSGNNTYLAIKRTSDFGGDVTIQAYKSGVGGSTIAFNPNFGGSVGIGTASPTDLLHVNGSLRFDGGLRVKVSTLSSNTTLDGTYHTVLVDTSGGSKTITLPSASSHPGREYRIKNKSTGVVSIAGTVDGKSSGLKLNMNDAATLVSDGSSWFLL